MQHTAPKQHITLEIPASRKAFWDWYEADRNKRFIYFISLALWLFTMVQMFTVLPLTATSEYRVAFYLPLCIFTVLLATSTHWLVQCALTDYKISHIYEYHPNEADTAFDLPQEGGGDGEQHII